MTDLHVCGSALDMGRRVSAWLALVSVLAHTLSPAMAVAGQSEGDGRPFIGFRLTHLPLSLPDQEQTLLKTFPSPLLEVFGDFLGDVWGEEGLESSDDSGRYSPFSSPLSDSPLSSRKSSTYSLGTASPEPSEDDFEDDLSSDDTEQSPPRSPCSTRRVARFL